MNPLLQELIEVLAHSPDSLAKWFSDHAAQLTPAMAVEAREAYEQAGAARDLQTAFAALRAASLICLHTGQPYEALQNYFDLCQLEYMTANTVSAYEAVHQMALGSIARAEEIKAADLAFEFAGLTAVSAWFALQAATETETQEQWLLTALSDLVTAAHKAQPYPYKDRPPFQAFISLLCDAGNEAISRFRDQERPKTIEALLRQLASAAESLVPSDFRYPSDPSREGPMAAALASLSYRYGNAAAADAWLDAALQRAAQAGDIESWIELISARYVEVRHAGISDLGLLQLRRELRAHVEQFRLHFRSRAGRLWTAQVLEPILGEFLREESAKRLFDDAELFATIESGKARTLLDQMTVGARDFATPELEAQAAELERQILRFAPNEPAQADDAEWRLASQLSIGGFGDSDERRQLLLAIESFYAAQHAGFEGVATVAALAQVMQALQPGEALIEYCSPYLLTHPAYSLFAIVVTPQAARVIPLPLDALPASDFTGRVEVDGREPLDASPLGAQITSLRIAIQQLDDGKALDYLDSLYKLLIAPLVQAAFNPADFKRWIIVPHGVLHYLPFGALLDSGAKKHLIEQVAIALEPSASVWLARAQAAVPPVTSFLGLANPILAGLTPLPQAEIETNKIAQSLPALACKIYAGPAATETVLRAGIPSAGIVHLATHGAFPESDVIDFHSILLTPTPQADGRVSSEELRRMDMSKTWLFTLSICDGCVHRFGPGDEPYGLISALLTAGAGNIIGPLWRIKDVAGRAFMVEFYRHLLAHGPAEALRRACIQALQGPNVLRDWTGFVLVGTGRPLAQDSASLPGDWAHA